MLIIAGHHNWIMAEYADFAVSYKISAQKSIAFTNDITHRSRENNAKIHM